MSILYRAVRVGQHGLPFTLYKFRTMVENADAIGGSSTADDDPRITCVGRILRKTKLDELPQLINVIKGDMALIGWRPESPEYLDTIPLEVLATKPGIIGWATLHDIDEGAALKGQADPDAYYVEHILPEKRKNELWYVQNKNLWLDIKIVWLTLLSVLRLRRGVLQ